MKTIRLFTWMLAVSSFAIAIMGCQAPRLPWRKAASLGPVAQANSVPAVGQQNLATTTRLGAVSPSPMNAKSLDQSSIEAAALASTSARIDSATSSAATGSHESHGYRGESASRSGRSSSSGCSSGCCSR